MATLLVDAQALVSQYLRSRSEVTALVGQRVVSHLAADQVYPALRVVRVAGAPVYSVPLFFDEAWFQVDAFGGTTAQAWTLAATAQAVLTELPSYSTALGQVTGVRFGSFAEQDDEAFSAPKPRWRFDVTVWTRPKN